MKHVKRKTGLLLLAAGLLIGAWAAGVPDWLRGLAAGSGGMADAGGVGLALYLALFVGLGAVGVPPVLFMVPTRFIWPDSLAFGVSLTGGMGAALTGFWLSRYLAREAFAKRVPQRFHRYDRRLQEYGFKTVVALRLLFFLMPPVNWLLGLSRLRTGTFVLATLLGALPGTLFFTFVGKGLIQMVREGRPEVVAGLVLLVVLAGVAWFVGVRLVGGSDDDDDSDREGLLPGLFWDFLCRYCRLSWRAFFPPPGAPRPSWRRVAILALFVPGFGLLMLIHWMAFLLDEVFFSSYHDVAVSRPLFVVGVPRSGTTFLHRVLAEDRSRYATFSLWELLFAPSILQRKVILALAGVDRRLGRPMRRVVSWTETRCAGGLADIHRLSLTAAEEDFVLLLPILSCFILIVAFPDAADIQDLAFFDERLTAERKRQVMAFYRRALQKHLYVHGQDCTLLSKNVSFTPLLLSLLRTFPHARVVACTREPREAVLSQISSMEGSWKLFGNAFSHEFFRDRWLASMRYAYEHLADVVPTIPPKQCYLVDMSALTQELESVIRGFYERFDLSVSPEYAAILRREDERAKAYISRHSYAPEDYDLSFADLTEAFAEAYARLERESAGAVGKRQDRSAQDET